MFKSVLSGAIVSALLLLPSSISAHLNEHEDKNGNKVEVSQAHKAGEVTYLANEGLMIQSGKNKILFDPFFHNDFGHYPLVPDAIRGAIFAGKPPYDKINAVFISHAHEDHFSAEDMQKFLAAHPKAHLFAPKQAVEQLQALVKDKSAMGQVTAVELEYNDKPWRKSFAGLEIEAVRIPHAGGQPRRYVQNMVFRVKLDGKVTVMHMGDADPNDAHFKPYADHWMQKQTDTAFPPYWFLISPRGQKILTERINAKEAIGIHVPVKVPSHLSDITDSYFSKPGEKRIIGGK